MKNRFGYLNSGQNSFFFNQQPGFSRCCFGNTAKRGVVAITDIFGESQFNKSVGQFFYFHRAILIGIIIFLTI